MFNGCEASEAIEESSSVVYRAIKFKIQINIKIKMLKFLNWNKGYICSSIRSYATSIGDLSSFGVIHKSKRLGRGRSSGKGKTSGRGHNGQLSRGDGKVAPWFEGGQTPLTKKFPKKGFKNRLSGFLFI